MTVHLLPCPACDRHIRASERDCPFCGTAFERDDASATPPAFPAKRLGSVAIMMFRTTAFGAAIAACGGTDTSDAASDGGSEVGNGAGGSVGIGGAPNDNIGGSLGQGGSPGQGGGINVGGSQIGAGGAPPYDGGPTPIYKASPRGP
jgi:hypothetical protein